MLSNIKPDPDAPVEMNEPLLDDSENSEEEAELERQKILQQEEAEKIRKQKEADEARVAKKFIFRIKQYLLCHIISRTCMSFINPSLSYRKSQT